MFNCIYIPSKVRTVIGLIVSHAPQQEPVGVRSCPKRPRHTRLFLLFQLGQSLGLWYRLSQRDVLLCCNAFLAINLPIFIGELRAKLYQARVSSVSRLQGLILCRGGERKKRLKIKADDVLSATQETEETVSDISKDNMQIPKAFPAAQITIRKPFHMIDSFACLQCSVTSLFVHAAKLLSEQFCEGC